MSYAGTNQKTLIKSVKCSGVGLHTGIEVMMRLVPAPVGTGIVFKRVDIEGKDQNIKAQFDNVTETRLGTTISNQDGVKVSTIEHLLSAIYAYGLDNLYIEIDGPEVPVMDGSAAPFMFFIECAGVKTISAPKEYIRITKTVRVSEDDKFAELKPSEEFKMNFDIDFESSAIGQQALSLTFSHHFFKIEIARARTFGFAHEVEMLRNMGLARGGSMDNAIVIEDGKILNKNGLRYNDEFVRHKLLDAVGDLSLAGKTIIGEYTAYKSGHDLNNKLLRAVFEQEAYVITSFKEEAEASKIQANLEKVAIA